MTRAASPITASEFARQLARCRPPTGWLPKLGVASSGGPDSTCLVFLLDRFIRGTGASEIKSLTTFTVDHGLQESSADMAKHVENTSAKMNLEHLTCKVSWGSRNPADIKRIELEARHQRYDQLFTGMTRAQVKILATAHHADDQVETALIRMSKGSKAYGISGMKPCRRWGMGFQLHYYGLEGMERWLIRPLLNFSKDRILATCEENKLDYVMDQTNFQPSLTLRNAIRQRFNQNSRSSAQPIIDETLPEHIKESLQTIETTMKHFRSVDLSMDSDYEYMKTAISHLGARVEDIDLQVDNIINQSTLPSPPSTYFISCRALQAIQDPEVQTAFVYRILRYVTFHPWGSLQADANRKSTKIELIKAKLWTPDPLEPLLPPFTGGSGVQWSLACTQGENLHMVRHLDPHVRRSFTIGWVAYRPKRYSWQGLNDRTYNDLVHEVGLELTSALRENQNVLDILFDNRFRVRFDLLTIPRDIRAQLIDGSAGIRIVATTKWNRPSIRLITNSGRTVTILHSAVENTKTQYQVFLPEPVYTRTPPVESSWITSEFIRPITAL